MLKSSAVSSADSSSSFFNPTFKLAEALVLPSLKDVGSHLQRGNALPLSAASKHCILWLFPSQQIFSFKKLHKKCL